MSQRMRLEGAASQQKSRWRLVLCVVAGILGAVFVFGIIGVLLILHTSPPPITHTDPAAANRLQQELQDAQTTAASGTQGVVRADETELNSLISRYFQASTAKPLADSVAVIRDLKLNLADDRLRAYVLASVKGKTITVVLEGRVRTVNGYLEFDPISGRIGALPIPKESLKRAVQQMIATPEARESMRLPMNLRDLHVEDGKLVVVFK